EPSLLLQHVRSRRLRRFSLQRQVHALMPPILLRMPVFDPFELDPESQPPAGQLAQPVEGMRGRKRDPVIGPNPQREPKLFEGPLEDREGEFLLGGEQRLARQQIATREVGDGQGIAVSTVAEEKFPFVVRTPERIRLGGTGELGPGRAGPPSAAMAHQVVAIETGVNRTDGRRGRACKLLPKFLPDLGRAPARVLPLQPHDRGFDGRWKPIRLPVRAVAPIAERLDPAVFVAIEDLVPGLARNPELGTQRRHLLALEQAGDKPESLVHDVTLLPRHAPSWRGQSVTHPLGIRCYLSLRKDMRINNLLLARKPRE